jgi:hypothetical protein
VTDRKEGYVLRKLQGGLSAIETWYECWNIKINEDKTQAFSSLIELGPLEAHRTLNGLNISFINHVKYLGVICSNSITWRLEIEMIEAKASRTFIRIYFQLKNERLSDNIKLTLEKTLIRSMLTYASSVLELAADTYVSKLQCLQNKVLHTIGTDIHTAFNLPYIYMII